MLVKTIQISMYISRCYRNFISCVLCGKAMLGLAGNSR